MTNSQIIDDQDNGEASKINSASRRDVLRAVGAAGAAATLGSLGTGTVAAADRSELWPDSSAEKALFTFSPVAYFGGAALDKWVPGPWNGEQESTWKDKYEYEQRLDIYRSGFDMNLMNQRLAKAVENQITLRADTIVEDASLWLLDEAEAGSDLSTAISNVHDRMDEEWAVFHRQLMEHKSQFIYSVEQWYDHLSTMQSELNTPVSYSLLGYCQYRDELHDPANWEGYGPDSIFRDVSMTLVDGTSFTARSMVAMNSSVSPSTVSAWIGITDFPIGATSNQYNDTYVEYQDFLNNRYTGEVDSSYSIPYAQNDGHTFTSIRIHPPDPVDFDVNEEDVHSVDSKFDVVDLNLEPFLEAFESLDTERTRAQNALETFANGNYSDMQENPEQWDRTEMQAPAHLVDASQNASTASEAAIGLYGLGIPVNLQDDVLVEFPNITDSNGNPAQVAGYLGMDNPPSGGIPIGDVVDPADYSGGVYFAYEVGAFGPYVEGDYLEDYNTSDNTSDNETDTSTVPGGTHTQIEQPFRIIEANGDHGDAFTIESREIGNADYSWDEMRTKLEELNKEQQEAQERTITVDDPGAAPPGGAGGAGAFGLVLLAFAALVGGKKLTESK